MAEPLATAEAKSFLRVDTADDDTLIDTFVVAARLAAEAEMRRALVSRTETLYLDAWPSIPQEWFDGVRELPITQGTQNYQELPFGTLQSVTSVTTYDDSDSGTVMSSDNYYVDLEKARVVLRSGQVWPTPTRVAQGIKIIYVTGYVDAAATPQAIKQGILNHVGVMYEKRDANADMPASSKAMYGPYYVVRDMI